MITTVRGERETTDRTGKRGGQYCVVRGTGEGQGLGWYGTHGKLRTNEEPPFQAGNFRSKEQ